MKNVISDTHFISLFQFTLILLWALKHICVCMHVEQTLSKELEVYIYIYIYREGLVITAIFFTVSPPDVTHLFNSR
jgi:hypothetical protein